MKNITTVTTEAGAANNAARTTFLQKKLKSRLTHTRTRLIWLHRQVTPASHFTLKSPRKIMLYNLTPHTVRVFSATDEIVAEIPPSGMVARIEKLGSFRNDSEVVSVQNFGDADEIWEYNIPILTASVTDITDLPDEQANVRFIVSAMLRAACPDRPDLVSPADLVRDESGSVIGCRAFEANHTF